MTSTVDKVVSIYRDFTLQMCLSRLERCQEVILSPFLQEIRDMLQETEKTSNLMAIKEKDMQDQGVDVIRYQEYVMQAQVQGMGQSF